MLVITNLLHNRRRAQPHTADLTLGRQAQTCADARIETPSARRARRTGGTISYTHRTPPSAPTGTTL